MAQRTYEITPRQQYDPNGARVEFGPLSTSYYADGRYSHGQMPRLEDSSAVEAAVLRVIATGQPETIVLGEPDKIVQLPKSRMPICPKCGTVCYGDCE